MIKNSILVLVFFLCTESVIQAQTLNVAIISSQNATCNGVCNGSASAQASGGTGSYTYLWSNGSELQGSQR